MGIDVRSVPVARFSGICGIGPSTQSGIKTGRAYASYNFASGLSRAAAERRAAALGASIEQVLIDTAARTSEQLKSNQPKLSAATVSRLAKCIPLASILSQ
jgi:hypothetical protein